MRRIRLITLMNKMNKIHRKYPFLALLSILMLATIFSPQALGPTHETESDSIRNETTTSDSFRSDITLSAVQNLTFSASNLSTIEIPSQASPIDPDGLAIDVVRGFEPEHRFNSQFNVALQKSSNINSSALKEMSDGLSLFYNTSGYPSYAAYNLSFVNPLSVSGSDSVSLAFWTSSSFNSSQALIGVSLMLRDQQGNRYFVSVVVSDQHSSDSFGLSEWFLGTGFTSELPKYPYYSMRYGSVSGPWFKQLSLSGSFALLNLSTAWLDGLLVGGEIGYIGPPLWVIDDTPMYSMTQMDAMFYFTLVHPQPFLINQQPVNSTVVIFPYQKSLSFSGILGRTVVVAVKGFLNPVSDVKELLIDETGSSREVLFDLSRAVEAGVAFQEGVNITVFSKSVQKCLLTLNNDTVVDLTDALLRSSRKVYVFPKNTSTLKVLLIFYKFNAWIFSFSYLSAIKMTKSGIVGEQVSAVSSEGSVDINATVGENTYLAIRTAGLTPRRIVLDGVEKLVESMLVVGEEIFFIVPLGKSREGFSLYSIQYLLSGSPLYESSTVTPLSVRFNGSVFSILTPLNIECEQGFYVPITVQMITYRTFTLQVGYDHSFFEAEQKEIMAYSSRRHYEYFALKPLQTGQGTVSLKITDTADEKAIFSTVFSVHVSGSFASRILIYLVFGITVLSVVVIFEGRSLFRRLLRR